MRKTKRMKGVAMQITVPPNDREILVILEYRERCTSVPQALTRNPKLRKMITCDICGPTSNPAELRTYNGGVTYCRPPDKFSIRIGATLAFRRAVDAFCKSGKFTDYFGDKFVVRRTLWNQFIKIKAWRRTCTK